MSDKPSWRKYYYRTSSDLSDYLKEIGENKIAKVRLWWRKQEETDQTFKRVEVGGNQGEYDEIFGKIVKKHTPLGEEYYTVDDPMHGMVTARDVVFMGGQSGIVYNKLGLVEPSSYSIADWRIFPST